MSTKHNNKVYIKVGDKYCKDNGSEVKCNQNVKDTFTLYSHPASNKRYIKGNGDYIIPGNEHYVGKWCHASGGFFNKSKKVRCNDMKMTNKEFTLIGDSDDTLAIKYGSKYCKVEGDGRLKCNTNNASNASKFTIEEANNAERCLYTRGWVNAGKIENIKGAWGVPAKMSLNQCKEKCIDNQWDNCIYRTKNHPNKVYKETCAGAKLSGDQQDQMYAGLTNSQKNNDTNHTTLFFKDKDFNCAALPTYQIKINQSNNKCIDAPHRHAGSQIYTWACNPNNRNQQWQRDGHNIKLKDSDMCIDAPGRGKNGGKQHLWYCGKDNNNQHWTVGQGLIKSKHNNTSCLDVAAGKGRSHNGGKVHMWTCNSNNANQKMSFNKI